VHKATISQIKNQLSRYLRLVRAGESVLILDRDRPVARIEPITAGGEADERLARLERAGMLRRASGSLEEARPLEGVPGPSAGVLAALLEERREGR
jgi:antitoxin (DNA-binding transcriptional repressor) of toxin-antitoxin stability system